MTRRKKTASPKRQPAKGASPVTCGVRFDRIRPWLLGGATALFVARPLFASESAVAGDGIGIVLAWVLLGIVGFYEARRSDGPIFRWTIADLCFGGFLLWSALSGIISSMSAHARPAVNMVWQWVGLGLGFFLIRQFLGSAREKRALVAVMIAVAFGLSSYGLYQYGIELPQSRANYQRNPDKVLRDAGLWYPPGSVERQLFESRLQDSSPLGTFALTNSLAGFLAPWFVVLVGISGSMAVAVELRKRWWQAAVCLIPIAVCLWLTHSRTGVGAVLIGVGILILYAQRKRVSRKQMLIATAIVCCGMATAVGIASVRGRVLDGAVKSFGYRLEYWYSSSLLVADSPIFGCGPGGFQAAYTAYKLPQASEEVADPHNFLVEVTATTGIPGLLLFLGTLFCVARQVWMEPARKTSSEGSVVCVYWGAIAGVVLSVPMGLMSTAPPGWASLAVAVPCGGVAVCLLSPWVAKGECSARLLLLGAFVLLVNLLAAGGIGFPGVAGSLWLLAGVALWSVEGSHGVSRIYATVGLVVCCVLLGACHFSAYKPNVDRRRHMVRAMEGPANDAVVELRQAAEADPLSAEPWQKLSSFYYQTRENPNSWELFEEATRKAIEKDPLSAPFLAATGERYFNARGAFAEKAVEAFKAAIRLYPNNAVYHGRLALAFQVVGREEEARNEAEIAFRLDEQTPHKDKKLPQKLRERLPR